MLCIKPILVSAFKGLAHFHAVYSHVGRSGIMDTMHELDTSQYSG